MALEALKKISEIKNIENSLTSESNEKELLVPKTKWLVFYIGETQYAVKECDVQNILKSVTLYDFPFAPIFVEGVINFHNKIYSVIDYKKLVEKENTGAFSENSESVLYLVLKNDSGSSVNGDFAIKISAVEDFFMIPDENYSASTETNSEFVSSFVSFREEKIPVLDIEAINLNVISRCSKEN